MTQNHLWGNLFALILLVSSAIAKPDEKELTIGNEHYKLHLDVKTGSIKSIIHEGVNLVEPSNGRMPLFTLRFRDEENGGAIKEYNALQAAVVKPRHGEGHIIIDYRDFENTELEVTVRVQLDSNQSFMKWRIELNNNTGLTLDHIDFPYIEVPNDLIATGGTATIFWPGMEGVLVEDITIREDGNVKYRPIEPPTLGWTGTYPSSAQMQYMAYYKPHGGLYVAAHDPKSAPKGIEFYRTEHGGIKLDFRLFPEKSGASHYKMPFDMVVGVFKGDWYDASAIYRDWIETSDMPRPPKIADNEALPDWYFESPVVLTYPVRGHKDLGDMTPNAFYPYTNALPVVDKYNQLLGSKVMALLMHWEGSAPWAPPYVWPPYGGETNYMQFVKALHENGNLAGLYASGIGYTLQSNTDTSYHMHDEYHELGLKRLMKVAPDGNLANYNVCVSPTGQRLGYDMCPSDTFVKDVVLNEISNIVESGTDYIQYFDQNLGGACYACYGTSHGHQYGPGLWQNERMIDIYESIASLLQKAGDQKPIIGCEAAAAEPFMPYLLFNDLRSSINLAIGRPVPAYAFVNHEYVNNFMGNQNGVIHSIDVNKSPNNLLQRIAGSFVSGDMLTLVLRGDGNAIWDWGTAWEDEVPNQDDIISLVRNLNSWRTGLGKDFLVYGRMMKPLPFEGSFNVPMITKATGKKIDFPSVLTSSWELDDKRGAQFFVNYLPEEQVVSLDITGLSDVMIFDQSTARAAPIEEPSGQLRLPPLSAVMVTYTDRQDGQSPKFASNN